MTKPTQMHTCPTCKGAGEMDVKVTEVGRGEVKHSTVTMTCYTCGGAGEMTDEQMKAYEAEKAMWCRCGRSEYPVYHDGPGHYWSCEHCGGVVQTG